MLPGPVVRRVYTRMAVAGTKGRALFGEGQYVVPPTWGGIRGLDAIGREGAGSPTTGRRRVCSNSREARVERVPWGPVQSKGGRGLLPSMDRDGLLT